MYLNYKLEKSKTRKKFIRSGVVRNLILDFIVRSRWGDVHEKNSRFNGDPDPDIFHVG
jgi:hypothetical protein